LRVLSCAAAVELKELDGFVKQLQGLAPLALTNTNNLNYNQHWRWSRS